MTYEFKDTEIELNMTLSLTLDEARILKAMMQNKSPDFIKESDGIEAFRTSMFTLADNAVKYMETT
jgi:hypothetical protein